MQDRYAGDIGDFGKFGLLKAIESQGLVIGVNWYLTCPTEKEQKRSDGNKTIHARYADCDEALFIQLCEVFDMQNRSVQELERRKLLQSAVYYNKPVKTGTEREKWHSDAVQSLAGADVVFLDPDNGLITETAKKSFQYAVKYVKDKEIQDYLKKDKAVIFYQHRPRKKEQIYFTEMRERIGNICGGKPCKVMSMTFRRGTVRDYFILCPSGRYFALISAAAQDMKIKMGTGKKPIVSQVQILDVNGWTEL